MYENFYGLSASPFQLTPDARFFYESTVHRQAMAYLVYGLLHAEGFIIITGEVGAGKTILVDNLLATIDKNNFAIAKIVTTQLAGDDLLHLVAAGFGIAKEGLAKGALLQRITDFVLAQQRNGRRVLLIVDEAQNLSFEALEELRMLSNIVVGNTMALQSFLLGQPQFRAMLGSPQLEQLRQRVTAAYHLGSLSEGETRAYIEHRLRRANWQGDPQFTENCFPVIYRHTAGVPRRINALCSRLLLSGSLEELHTLEAAIVERVANDLRREMADVTRDRTSEVSRPKPNWTVEAPLPRSQQHSAHEPGTPRFPPTDSRNSDATDTRSTSRCLQGTVGPDVARGRPNRLTAKGASAAGAIQQKRQLVHDPQILAAAILGVGSVAWKAVSVWSNVDFLLSIREGQFSMLFLFFQNIGWMILLGSAVAWAIIRAISNGTARSGSPISHWPVLVSCGIVAFAFGVLIAVRSLGGFPDKITGLAKDQSQCVRVY